MTTDMAPTELGTRAAEALKVLLSQVSGVRLTEMKREPQARGRAVEIVARIDVFGHTHTLACEVHSDGEPDHVRAALHGLRDSAAHLPANTTPLLIAPYLSPEAQAFCNENQAGFLDLEGNARLTVGEVFIGTRSLPCHAIGRLSAAYHQPPARSPANEIVHDGLRRPSRSHTASALVA